MFLIQGSVVNTHARRSSAEPVRENEFAAADTLLREHRSRVRRGEVRRELVGRHIVGAVTKPGPLQQHRLISVLFSSDDQLELFVPEGSVALALDPPDSPGRVPRASQFENLGFVGGPRGKAGEHGQRGVLRDLG